MPPPTPTASGPPTASRVPILLVDDNASKRLALRAVLQPLGYSIIEADSGSAALRCVLAQDFAAILLDVSMPIMNGFETAALIRKRRQSEMTPIIFITAYASDELVSADRYVEGAVDFLCAPVQPDELRAKVAVFAKIFVNAELLAHQTRDLQTSTDQLRLLTEAAPIGIFQTDERQRFVYTNPRWTELTGVAPEEAIGREWGTLIGSEESSDLVAELLDSSVYRGEACQRFEIKLAGSTSRIVLMTSTPIPDAAGGVAGWVGTLSDVTAEANAGAAMSAARDKATEASRLKSDFLANMSHEIRTPMNGVIGMTDLLLETDLDELQRDYAQTLRNSGEALLTIINDILDFSKIEAGKLAIENVEFSLRTIVEDVVDLLAGTAQAKGLELIAVVGDDVPPVVIGDPGRVRQVLTNLLGNAIKFTAAGEIVVRVAEMESKGTRTLIRFEVSDTGEGIAPEKLDLVFQPFVQADSSTSRRHGGTGLGLSISSQLVALMGGDCGVASRLGTGSTFWFTIRALTKEGYEPEDARPPDIALAGVSALVVDTNATQREVLSAYLTGWGMAVSTSSSAVGALETLRGATTGGRPIALTLLDQSVPGIDGLDLKDAIAVDPSFTTCLLLMTGVGRHRRAADSRPALYRWLSKPIHRDHLRAGVLAALVSPAAEAAVPAAPGPASSPAPGGSAGRLLLAEDNVINQKVARAMLSGAGYEVDTVRDGAAAVAAAADHTYDAILMDCQMPELNGYEATAAIRAGEGTRPRVPIIAMTASAGRAEQERCIAGGMDGYLSKPVSKDVLLALVAQSVRASRA